MTATGEVCADLRAHMAARATVTVDRTRLMWAASAVTIGLEQIAAGKTGEGLRCAEHGLKFLQRTLEDQR